MSVRKLRKQMRFFRIGDPNGTYPIYSGKGAALVEGRWHNSGQEVIYASVHYSLAMLEKLAHFNGVMPPDQHFIEIIIPAGTSYEVVTKDRISGWDLPDSPAARAFGSNWLDESRSAILLVPSYVAREEENVLINPDHPDSKAIEVSLERPVWWDERLFNQHED